MKYLISYDISNGENRNHFMKFLLSQGFLRIQKSVFLGNIHKEFILEKIKGYKTFMKSAGDSVMIVPICISDIEKSKFLGIGFDEDVLDSVKYFMCL
ncbi:CRISPR-associated endonuclease Cas2 [Fusobacterium sp. PH5-44]|uniref:CRISPR-associated endonuclease Cas2 n=1 Tax=unclassified Fusobacterium TaxID=2648384 RepID=UPI003D20C63C